MAGIDEWTFTPTPGLTTTSGSASFYCFPACECPVAWWGLSPPPCPVHNPPVQTWTYRIVGPDVSETKPEPAKGWECPRCTRINAPHTPFCCKETP